MPATRSAYRWSPPEPRDCVCSIITLSRTQVTARVNPALNAPYDDIDLQHAIAQEHWYVCGYKMSMKHPITEETHHLFHDADPSTPMFRVVVKANLSMPMADNLVASIKKSFAFLDAHGAGFNSHPHHAHQPHHKAC